MSETIITVRRLKRSATTPESGPTTTLGNKRATIIKPTSRPDPVKFNTSVITAMVSNESPSWLTTCPSSQLPELTVAPQQFDVTRPARVAASARRPLVRHAQLKKTRRRKICVRVRRRRPPCQLRIADCGLRN